MSEQNNESVAEVLDQDVVVEDDSNNAANTESEGNGVTDTESPTGNDQEELKDDEDKPLVSKKNYNKRIQQVIEQRKAADEKAARLEKELAEVRKIVPQATKEVDISVDFHKPKPDMSQYTTIGEYTEALSDWKFEQREYVKEQKAVQVKQQEAVKKASETWTTKETAIKSELEDYDAVVNMDSLNDFNITKQSHVAARSFLSESDVGPAVLYELLQNEELAKTFKDANQVQQIKILTKIETRLEGNKSTTSPESTTNGNKISIPPKLKGAIKGSNKTLNDVVSTGDFTEYAKWRKSQVKSRY